MRQLLLILTILMFGVAHAAAAPSALCRHANVDAHVQALSSADARIAAQAHHEDSAAAVASKLASLSEHVPAALGTAVLPENAAFIQVADPSATIWPAG